MKMSNRSKGKMAKALSPFFRLLDFLWQKDRNLVVFYSGRRMEYSDNTRYLFEKFIESYSDEFSILWATWSESTLRDTRIDERWRRHMVTIMSIRGIVSLLRAKVILFSWGAPGFPGTWFSSRTVKIQLWHGIPIKRIGKCSRHRDANHTYANVRGFDKYDYWICSSIIERNNVSLCAGIPIDKVKITGYPRNDYLIEHRSLGDPKLLAHLPFLKSKVILYAPTWRPNEGIRFFPFEDFRNDELLSLLERHDAYLILRTHLSNNDVPIRLETEDNKSLKSTRTFTLNQDSFRDVQELLPYVDILISDYSGIWLDFLLLDRPVIFVPYDLATYERDIGLLFDFDSITPGPKVHRFAEMLNEIESYLVNPSRDSESRNQIRRLFHKYDDGLAYERIHQLVKDVTSISSETIES